MGLRMGVIGLGQGSSFVEACNESDLVESIAVCDTRDQKAEEIASKYTKVRGRYQDHRRMLEGEALDAVCVVTPDHLHRSHAEACLEAGLHVLLTKPIATNLEDAKSIILRAEETGCTLMVAHERRLRPWVTAIRRYLEAGDLGEIIQIRYDSIHDKRQQFAAAPWFASPEARRTALSGSGIHMVDAIRYLVGKPIVRVSAFSNRLGTLAFPADKTTAAIFQFEGGIIGEVTVTLEAHRRTLAEGENVFYLVGTRGVATRDRIICDAWDTWRELPRDPPSVGGAIHAAIKRTVHAFLQAIAAHGPAPITGREAYESLAACLAADESARRGECTVPARPDF